MERDGKIYLGEHPELRARYPDLYRVQEARFARLPNREEDWEDCHVPKAARRPPRKKACKGAIPPRRVKSLTDARKARRRIYYPVYPTLKPFPFCTHQPLYAEGSDWPLCLPRVPIFKVNLIRFHSNINNMDPIPPQKPGILCHPTLIALPQPIYTVVQRIRSLAVRGLYNACLEDATTAADNIPDEKLPRLQKSYLWAIAAHAAQFSTDIDEDDRIRTIEKYSGLAVCFFLDDRSLPRRYQEYYGEIKARAHYWGEIHHLRILRPGMELRELMVRINHERFRRLFREFSFAEECNKVFKVATKVLEQRKKEKSKGKRLSRFFRGIFGKSGGKDKDTAADKENKRNEHLARIEKETILKQKAKKAKEAKRDKQKKSTKGETKKGKESMTDNHISTLEQQKNKHRQKIEAQLDSTLRELLPDEPEPQRQRRLTRKDIYTYHKSSAKKAIRNWQKREIKVEQAKAEKEALAANPCRVLIKWTPPLFPIPPIEKSARAWLRV
ncbi:hypothetical protein Dda_6833 [Drechslerella dactyloides]|uniref:Uncharacterized protein n=1 Tax=Drechslerella dactyloides TaxID=74499 RepID=A0AAD6IWC3_DREDA|nr:hypothetical protein Dda_6833 [Drechslerella dactyloides]